MNLVSVRSTVAPRWIAAAGLGLLGLLVNTFPVVLSPGIDWLFGGVAYLLVAVAFGPAAGALAAAIASVRTVWLWNHPWAWLIFTLEGLTVGYLCTRWHHRPLTATALYWAAAGVPLLLIAYHLIMGVGGTTLAIIALKQPLNGLVNAVLVEALLLLPAVRRALRIPGAPRLRATLAVSMLIAGIIPAMVFGVWAGQREWARTVELAQDRVAFGAHAYATKLEQYMRLHQQEIRALAVNIESRPDLGEERLERLIAAETQEFSGFLGIHVTGAQGQVLASSASPGRPGFPRPRSDFRDRAFFEELRSAAGTVVSGVYAEPDAAGMPAVAIGHPIHLAGELVGFVIGVLDLALFPDPVIADYDAERLQVVDSHGRILFASDAPYQPREPLRFVSDSAAFAQVRAATGPGITLYQRHAPVTAASQVAAQVLVGYAPLPTLGWWSWVDYPFRQVEASVATPYARLLAILVALVALVGLSSTLLAGWLAAPLLRVRWAAAALAAGDRTARVRRLPAGVPHEIAELGSGFDEMADALAGRAAELETLSEIARSLASTLESRALLRQITDATVRLLKPDGCGIALLQPEGDALRADEYSLGLLAPSAGKEIPADRSLIGWVVRHTRSARVTNVNADPRVYPDGLDLRGIGSVICAPLVGRSGPLGALTAVRVRSHPHPFSDDDLQLLERLAGTAALAVENTRLLEAAQAASRAKSDFIAAMSHELRTPLNAVLGHLQLLELEVYGATSTRQREALGRIGAATRHLRSLIEEVLSFARLEAGRAEVHFAEVDVRGLVEEVTAVIEPLAWEKRLHFQADAHPVEDRLLTDPDKVRQILINLAGNAVKFTESGEVRLSVECPGTQPGGDAPGAACEVVVFHVSDTGPGIAEADQARLFQPFQQLDSGLARRHGGTGLGLYLSGQYARLLGGTIQVESAPNQGSTFSLVLPRDGRQAARGA